MIDKRTKKYKFLSRWFNKYTRAAFVAGIITGSLIGFACSDIQTKSPSDLESTIKPQVAIATTDKYKERGYPFCYDSIICIRDVGEELGVPNKDIITMIKIAKCESGMNPMALNKNTNGTFDVGLLQINDVHNKHISRQDRLNFELNIRYAYKLYKAQGFNPWTCYNKI